MGKKKFVPPGKVVVPASRKAAKARRKGKRR
jgi:hypothetical protein